MSKFFRILSLLLYKNYLVCKRQWIMGLIGEFIVPLGLITSLWALRNVNVKPSELIPEIWYEALSEEQIKFNFMRSSTVFYAPNNSFVNGLMQEVQKCIDIENYAKNKSVFEGYETEEILIQVYQMKEMEYYRKSVAVIFNDNSIGNSTKNFKYKIRTLSFYDSQLYNQNFVSSLMYDGFIAMQMCLDEAFIAFKHNSNNSLKQKIFIQKMPYPTYIKKNLNDVTFRSLFSVVTIIAFTIPLFIEVSKASNEKFLGVNVLMSMNGVSNALNLFSWLISGILFLEIILIIPMIVLLLFSTGDAIPYLNYGNPLITWLVLTFHIAHLLSCGIHVSAYFPRALLVIFGLLVINVCSVVLQQYGFKEDTYQYAPYLGILFPNILLFQALEELNYYELIAEGINWSNLFLVGNSAYKIGGSTGMILILSVIGIIFHFSMAIYIYAINPGKYGVRKHPLFFLKKCKSKSYISANPENLDFGTGDGKPFESVPLDVYTPGIQIRNLRKTYTTGIFNKTKVSALQGISVDFFEGQITSLLGHNGAGKTTMMSILTGMISYTEGLILVKSKDIRSHLNVIMSDMGLCTQDNMLFPSLTVIEQLEFFARLKGKNRSKAAVESNVKSFLEKLKLYDKRNTLPNKLSGGQKRRVCLGMALVCDPSILILDEPTSGLDPESRRVIWDILLKMRGRKTILISTHDMEEADILGDRIAILHSGQLKSYGTTMFLKKLIGQGNIEVTLSVEPSCDNERVCYELDCESNIINEDGSKIVFSVPNSPDLPDKLDNLERKKKELGITGLSVSLISLEQVFLKVTQNNNDFENNRKSFVRTKERLTGNALFWHSFRALLHKKMIYTKKNVATIFLMIFLLFLKLLFISLILKQTVLKPKTKLIPIHLDMYFEPETYYKSFDSSFGQTYKRLTEKYNGKANEANTTSVSYSLMNFAEKNLAYYDNHLIAAAEFNKSGDLNAFYSHKATYSLPISLNLLSNTILKKLLGDEYSISISGERLPDPKLINYSDQSTLINSFSTSIVFVFLLYPTFALFVLHPLRETSKNIKHLQRMAGVSFSNYWGTMFIFDLIVLLLLVVLIIIGFILMDYLFALKLYGQTEILILFALLVIFAFNVLPLIYTFSFIKASSNAVVRLLTYIPLSLVTFEIIMYTLRMALHDKEHVVNLRLVQKRIFLLIPYISFFHSQFAFYFVAQTNSKCKSMPNTFYDTQCKDVGTPDFCCELQCYDGKCEHSKKFFTNFEEDITLEESLIYMCVSPILYFGILAVLEYQLIQKLIIKLKKFKIPEYNMDEKVKQEKSYIVEKIFAMSGYSVNGINDNIVNGKTEKRKSHENSTNSIHNTNNKKVFIVYELSKRYGNLSAVKDVSFGVNRRECFGLLGVNGAGKSTTFKMMTGGELPDTGAMLMNDKDFKNNRNYFLSQMGYCPQNDALIKSLNAYDHLRLFARLRGIPEGRVEEEVNLWIQKLNLKACATQPSGTYSGGNKRRLNIAIALIGNPNLVLMDEPTTGVDPGARRSLWNVIQACQTMGQAVILTSHSMEECEALCNRLAIMVDGIFVCIGPSEELKQRFGAGFNIHVKLNPEKAKEQINGVKEDIEKSLNCEICDENLGYLMYHVMPHDTTWRKMYDTMNVIKSKYDCIDDYSVLSSTLEQLFLIFARAANDKARRKRE